jgi:hypothetical protein
MSAPDPITSPAALRAHLEECARARGRWHAVRGGLQSAHGWLRPRLVSTVLALLILLAGVLWLA